MKFGKSFEHALETENFPKEWVSASIQYKLLKKCINNVVQELSAMGLNASTLHLLVSSASAGASNKGHEPERPAQLQYEFEGTIQHFQPKILLSIDDDLAVSANLAPETRKTIGDLMNHHIAGDSRSPGKIVKVTESNKLSAGRSDLQAVVDETLNSIDEGPSDDAIFETGEDLEQSQREYYVSHQGDYRVNQTGHDDLETKPHYHTIEITLYADSEFFHLLANELASIDTLQAQQKNILTSQVQQLGKDILAVTRPSRPSSPSDLYAWREVFSLYVDAAVFFATKERDHGARTAQQARERIQWFSTQLENKHLKFRNKGSKGLLSYFLNINKTLLQSLLFQEINFMATQKILKKFDKRTSLSASSVFPEFMSSDPFFADSLARAVCSVMSDNLLSVLPQLDDYLCPVCTSITFRPGKVRLICSHVFCIRCLVVLQRQKKSQCPICRRDVVLQADSGNIDEELLRFLKSYFPKEVKAKQAENERAAGIDQLERVGLGPRQKQDCIIS